MRPAGDRSDRSRRRREGQGGVSGLALLTGLALASAAGAQPAASEPEADRPACLERRSGEDRPWCLTLGGEFRPFYERYDHYNWGAGPEDDNGFYLQRLMVHADVHVAARTRVFVEVKHGIAVGRVGGPRPPDEDRLDLNQAYVDIHLGPRRGSRVTLRLGRHEMDHGDGSLVSYREGPNVRRGYDGPKVMIDLGAWHVDAFAVRPVETDPGVFDDGPEPGQRFWGVYATAQRPMLGVFGRPELYYLGLARASVRYDQGTAREVRHTLGARTKYRAGGFEYWLEGTLQTGSFGDGTIRAWKHVQVYGYGFERVRLRPRVGLNLAISSGDDDPRDPDLQTFHPLFPRGLYYGYIDGSGSLNAIVLHPSTTLRIAAPVSLRGEVFAFWRQRASDGLYAQPGHLLRTGQRSDERFVGTLAQGELTWRLDPRATATLQIGRHWAGPYLRDTPPARNMTYLSAKVSYKF